MFPVVETEVVNVVGVGGGGAGAAWLWGVGTVDVFWTVCSYGQ